jgi:hypothetical protein
MFRVRGLAFCAPRNAAKKKPRGLCGAEVSAGTWSHTASSLQSCDKPYASVQRFRNSCAHQRKYANEWPNIAGKQPQLADADAENGRPGKVADFSPNPAKDEVAAFVLHGDRQS